METWVMVAGIVLLGNAIIATSRIRRKARMVKDSGCGDTGRGDYHVRLNWAILWVPCAISLSIGIIVAAPWFVAVGLTISSIAAPLQGFPPLKRTV